MLLRSVTLLGACVALLAACGGATDPGAGVSLSPTGLDTAGVDGPTPPLAGSQTETGGSTSPPTSTAAPASSERFTVRSFRVASPAGAHHVLDDEVTEVVHDPAAIAFADGAGGTVVQFTEGFHASTSEDTSIYHVRPDAEGPVVIVEGNIDAAIELHDVVTTGDRATVVYSGRRGDTPETARQELYTYDLGTGDTRLVAEIGGWESGADQLSFGGGRYLINMASEGTSWFAFRDTDGGAVDQPHNPLPEDAACFDDVTCPMNAVLDPTGGQLAFTRYRMADDGVVRSWELVVLDLVSGRSLLEWEEPYDDPHGPVFVDAGGGLVVVSLGSGDPQQPSWVEAIVFDLTGEEPGTSRLPIAGLATLEALPG